MLLSSVSQAEAAATTAARRAGVEVRELIEHTATAEAEMLFRQIWQTPAEAAAVSTELLRAFAKTGNYVAGAYAGGTLVGAVVAFFTDETPRSLHSHICGVVPAMQGRSVGFALKLHQRQWALRRGVGTINWTADPLVRRNVYFNMAKLGATVTEYLPDFYGQMADGVNAADASDRLLFTWSLTTDRVAAASNGSPCVAAPGTAPPLLTVGAHGEPCFAGADGDLLCCELPADILRIRQTDPPLARRWRQALRKTLATALRDGYQFTAITDDGRYLLTRDHRLPASP